MKQFRTVENDNGIRHRVENPDAGEPEFAEPDAGEDQYGNPTDGSRVINCCFPDCGCDGSRLCMAEQGASDRACSQNVEGMWQRSDKAARKALGDLMVSVYREGRE